MTDAERYAPEAAECDEQARRSPGPVYRDEWMKLARSYRLLAEQAAVGCHSATGGHGQRSTGSPGHHIASSL